ncbi:hypothetical protein [Nocardioides cavernaquae]|uniref:Twin-arginine translocation signal domain-containing protein n=1 Tax=Nocardioides cavernaquae TaxID=2321396 RepID=A0A3A5HA42_9ACTN|nr:hypothetical protein [Nocardioides cavernaquae]RJS44900.1 hypothetical protein D4739_00665 [Nocardioides cavernaquae]
MPQSDPHHPTRLTRRATLGSAAALTGVLSASLAGCEWGPPDQVDAPEAKKDADDKLAQAAAERIGAMVRLIEAVPPSFTQLAQPLVPLLALHQAHLAAVDPTDVAGSMPIATVAPASPADALAQVREHELALQRALTADASAATSGQLARTLASMAAAVAQQLAVLPTSIASPKGAQR